MARAPDDGGTEEGGAAEARASARAAALVVCLVLAAAWVLPVSLERSWGYDESMNAQLPALRMLHEVRAGHPGAAFDVLHGCSRYPFAYPVLLASAQAVFGTSELVGRGLGRVLWVIGCFAIFLLAQDVVRLLGRRAGDERAIPGARLAPWLALVFAACSPMTLMYSGTLFLEVPFAVAAVFALRALLRQAPPGEPGKTGEAGPAGERGPRGPLVLGAWLTLCFFIKFNYGLLLIAGVGLELLCQGGAALRAGAGSAWLRRVAWIAAPPAVGALWWFALPLPAGTDVAALHRSAFIAFLTENTDASLSTGWDYRFKDWSVYLVYSPLVLLALLVGLLGNLGRSLQPGLRPLLLVALALLVPPAFHSFHVDRFLIPGSVALWVLAGLGLARLAPRGALPRAALGAAALAAILGSTPALSERAMSWVRLMPTDEVSVAYARRVLSEHRSLDGGRPLVTVGVWREDAQAVGDLIAAGTGPDERIGWLGIASGYSRAALHAGLLERGAAPARFLRDAGLDMFIETAQADPGLGAPQLEQWAARFDVVLHSSPVDLLDHRNRRFMQRYVDLLHASGAWTCASIGTLAMSDAQRNAHAVELYACRRTQ